MAFFFLCLLGFAQPLLFVSQLFHKSGPRLAVLLQGIPLFALVQQRHLHVGTLFDQGQFDHAQFPLGGLDLVHLFLADGRVGLHPAEAHGGLIEVVCCEHKKQRVVPQLHPVGLLDHACVFVLQGGHVSFEGLQLGVRPAHGTFQRADGGLMVSYQLLAQLDLLVQQAHLGGSVCAVASGLSQ